MKFYYIIIITRKYSYNNYFVNDYNQLLIHTHTHTHTHTQIYIYISEYYFIIIAVVARMEI
jgi:hypothetical protein